MYPFFRGHIYNPPTPSSRVFDIFTFHPKPLPLKKEGLVVAFSNHAFSMNNTFIAR
jgi:hypothetical protein